MLIDIHAHIYRKPFMQLPGRAPWPTPDDLLAAYDRLGVDKGVLQVLLGPEFYSPQPVEDILDAAAAHPDRFIPFCNVHPRALTNDPAAPLEKLFALYKEAGCKGIGEVIANMSFFDPYMLNLLRAAEAVELPVTIHLGHREGGCYGIVDQAGLPGLDEVLQRFPKLKILGHSMPFWAEIAELDTVYDRTGYPAGPVKREGALPKIMRKRPNLYCDLSAGSGANALLRDEVYAGKFLTEFADRVLFGLDICSVEERPYCRSLIDLLLRLRDGGAITSGIFAKVTHQNAIRLLNL